MADKRMLRLGLENILPYPVYQIPGLILLVVIIIGWVIYRRKQM